MRAHNRGSLVSIVASRRDCCRFNDRWPCSTLPEQAARFDFDRRTGDLVDLSPAEMDGPEVAALAQDCKTFARRRGLIP